MLSILDLFTEKTPVWTADAVCERLNFSTSTGYRYIRELSAAGLLTRITGGAYVLGARIIELEALMRMIDPISRLGRAIILPLVKQTGCDALLSNVYGDHVINVLHERGMENLPLTYLRGRPHPLFRGAMSKAIIAFLPRARAARLYAEHRKEIATSAAGRSWEEFWQQLQATKKKGYSESHGELDPGVMGFGVPVFNGEEVLGSVALACSPQRIQVLNEETLIALLKDAAARIGKAIEDISHPQTPVMALSAKNLKRLKEPRAETAS